MGVETKINFASKNLVLLNHAEILKGIYDSDLTYNNL